MPVASVCAQFSPYKIGDVRKDFEHSKNDPAVLSADSVKYEENKTLFQAMGKVTLRQAGLLLCTEKLRYDTEKENVFLPTPFSLEYSNGDILRASCGYFLNNLKKGEVQEGNLLTHTRERIVARLIRKNADNTTEFEMASYTPCERCVDQLEPTWALYARHVEKNDNDNTMGFTDTHLSFLGVPVAYSPYFYFPTKRKSGFLLPYGSATKELGFYLGTPYYWVINSSGDNDLLVTPFVTTNGGVMLAADYRHRFNDGLFKIRGAVNETKEQTYPGVLKPVKVPATRGYANENIAYNFSPHWRLRSDEWWASDKTFLSTRPFFGQTTSAYLESRTQVEGFYTHHYVNVEGLRYQGLQDIDSPSTTPYIYPRTIYSYVTPDLVWGSYAIMNVETLSLYQQVGTQMQRGTVEGWWLLPIETDSGQMITPFGHVEGAVYRAREESIWDLLPGRSEKTTTRLYPQGGFDWKWPIATRSRPLFLFTPIVQMIMGAFHVNKREIPNEDSLGVAFTDSVLFQPNRFPGHDRVDDGARANYALSVQMFLPSGQSAQVFFGQSYSFSKPPYIIRSFGVNKGLSDYVGRVETTFQKPLVNIRYRFRFDQKTFSSRYQEIATVLGPKICRVSGGYVFSSSAFPYLIPSYNQLFLEIGSQFLKYWSGKLFITQNFKTFSQRQKLLDKGFGITYQDECLAFNLTIQHSFYKMQDLKPGVTVDFSLQLKNLGGFRQKLDRFTRREDIEPSDQ